MSELNELPNDSFLGNMQTTVVGKVVSMTRFDIDGTKGGSLWVSKPTSGRNVNLLGEELIKINMPFEMFDQQKQKLEAKEITVPGYFEILTEVDMGGGNRAKLTAISIRKYLPPASASTGATGSSGGASGTAAETKK